MIYPLPTITFALMEAITLFHTFVNIRTVNEYFEYLENSFRSPVPTTFFYLNTYSSYLCDTDPRFRQAFNASDYIVPDGSSIVMAIRLLSGIRIEKITINHTFIDTIASYFDRRGISLFLFGSTDETLRRAQANLHRDYPGIVIAGTHHGYCEAPRDWDRILDSINEKRPTVLFVGMGMPRSEVWITENKHRINVPCIVTVGNLIDIIAGEQAMAPRWLFNTGFEWVFRLLQDPLRLGPRYLKAHSRFLFDVLKGFRSGGTW